MQKLPTKRLNSAIRSVEENYYVCAATGRPWSFAKPVLHGMGLVDPSIMAGGTQVCDSKTGEILWQCDIGKSEIKAIKKVLIKYPGYGLLTNDYSEEQYFAGGHLANELDTDQNIFFCNYVFVPPAVAFMISKELKNIKGITTDLGTSQRPGLLDVLVTNVAATKEHAIAELLSLIRVDRKSTFGFGDGLNDIHLFNAVNTKVAMGNAVRELKDLADEVIASVSDDGLAQYLERLAV